MAEDPPTTSRRGPSWNATPIERGIDHGYRGESDSRRARRPRMGAGVRAAPLAIPLSSSHVCFARKQKGGRGPGLEPISALREKLAQLADGVVGPEPVDDCRRPDGAESECCDHDDHQRDDLKCFHAPSMGGGPKWTLKKCRGRLLKKRLSGLDPPARSVNDDAPRSWPRLPGIFGTA